MADTQLLPCPFCGGDAQTDFIEGESYIIECYACDCRTSNCDGEEAAIAAWNRRAALASRPAEVDDEIAGFEKTLRQSQVTMDPEIASMLGGNLWDLYEFDEAGAGLGGLAGGETAENQHTCGFQPVVEVAQEVDDEGLPAVLFDGHAVYSEITRALGKTHCHNHETVSATLDAVVRLMRQGQRDAVAADRARRGEVEERFYPQLFLNWNRSQENPPVAIGKEMGVARKAVELSKAAPSHTTNKEK